MSQTTSEIARAAHKAVDRLVAECRKGGPLYQLRPKQVAQVSRTAKWLLNALAALDRELSSRNESSPS